MRQPAAALLMLLPTFLFAQTAPIATGGVGASVGRSDKIFHSGSGRDDS